MRVGLFANSGWNFLNFRRELIEHLAGSGFEVHLIAPDYLDEIAALGEVHPFQLSPAGMNMWQEIGVIRRLRRHLSGLRLDALLTFTIKPNLYGSLAAPSRTKVICNVTGLGEMFHSSRSSRAMAIRGLYRVALSRSALTFVQNDDDLQMLQSMALVNPAKLFRIPGSGVNTAWFSPRESAEDACGQDLHFLFVGRFRLDKGFMEFVSAAETLRSQGCRARYTMIGAQEPGRRFSVSPEVLDQIRNAGLIRLVDFQRDIRPFIASASCVVLPSYREGLSRSLLEAASMCKPVITTDAPGCRESVVDGKTGFLCQVKSSDDLAQAMAKFLRLDRTDRESMGRAARSYVSQHFSVQRVLEIYSRQIGILLGNAAPVKKVVLSAIRDTILPPQTADVD